MVGRDLLLAKQVVDHENPHVLIARAERKIENGPLIFLDALIAHLSQQQIDHGMDAALKRKGFFFDNLVAALVQCEHAFQLLAVAVDEIEPHPVKTQLLNEALRDGFEHFIQAQRSEDGIGHFMHRPHLRHLVAL